MAHSSLDHQHPSRALWWLAILFTALTLAFGSYGIWLYEHPPVATPAPAPAGVAAVEEHPHHGLSPFYHAVQMLILHTAHFEHGLNGWIEAGRWCGVVAFSTFAMALFLKRLRKEWRLLWLWWWENQVVLCGLGAKGFELARCLRGKQPDLPVVVIDPTPEAHLEEECFRQGMCVVQGDASEEAILMKAGLLRAREVVVMTGDDATNLRIARSVLRLLVPPGRKAVPCWVNLSDIHLCEVLQRYRERLGVSNAVRPFRFFDVYDLEARRVLEVVRLDGPGIPPQAPHQVHVVMLGFGRMARSLALRAVKLGHFANNRPLRLTVIDRAASMQEGHFHFRHPALKAARFCRLEFIQAESESWDTRQRVAGWAAEPNTILHLFVCLDSDTRTIEVGLRLQPLLEQAAHATLSLRLRRGDSAPHTARASPIAPRPTAPLNLSLLPDEPTGKVEVRVFGMVEEACSEESFRAAWNEPVAQAIHESYLRMMKTKTGRSATDTSLREWEALYEPLRDSNRQQADHIPIKLRALGLELARRGDPRAPVEQLKDQEVDQLAPLEHRRWLAERQLGQWRYGVSGDRANRVSEHLRLERSGSLHSGI